MGRAGIVVLTVDNAWTHVSDPTCFKEVDFLTSYFEEGYMFSPLYKRRVWDGKSHLFKKGIQCFPTGLLPSVTQGLRARGWQVFLSDQRLLPQKTFDFGKQLHGITLRDYQKEAVESCIASGRGVVSAATNAGKTEIGIEVIRRLGLKTLWLTHRQELLVQTAKRFEKRLPIKVGRIGSGSWHEKDITIAMVQTLMAPARRKETVELLSKMQVVVVDEVHHAQASTWDKVLMLCPAYYRFGLSATPFDGAGAARMRIQGSLGDIIHHTSNAHLVAAGVSPTPEVEFVNVNAPDLIMDEWKTLYRRTLDGKLLKEEGIYEAGIAKNAVRTQVTVRKVQEHQALGRKVLCLVFDIAHGEAISGALSCPFVHGASDNRFRRDVLDAFKDGRERTLVTSTILGEGVDISDVDTVVYAAGGKSPIRLLQTLGRGMRQKPSARMYYVDFWDTHHPILLKHSRTRYNDLVKQGICDFVGDPLQRKRRAV